MRVLILAFLAVSAATLAAGSDAPALNGKWQLHISIMGNESDSACTFVQKDKDVSGTCVNENGPMKMTGAVTENKVNWIANVEYNGSPLTLKYAGSLDPTGAIKGSVTVEEYGVEGEFTATQAK